MVGRKGRHREMLCFCLGDVVILQLHPFTQEYTQLGLCSISFVQKEDFLLGDFVPPEVSSLQLG